MVVGRLREEVLPAVPGTGLHYVLYAILWYLCQGWGCIGWVTAGQGGDPVPIFPVPPPPGPCPPSFLSCLSITSSLTGAALFPNPLLCLYVSSWSIF